MKIRALIKENILYIGLGFTIIILFWATRLVNLGTLPIFTDEAIYVRWAQVASFDPNLRFISLVDGKQPSFVWIAMILVRFIQDPLIAGRMVSVLAGFGSLIGLFFLGREIFKSIRVGLLSSFLYLIFPMAMVYDRMALYDSLVGAFTIWSLFLGVLLIRYLRLDIALLLGMVAGAGVLTKSNAFFSIYLLPFTLILFKWNEKGRVKKLIQWVGLAIVASFIAYSMYSILRLSPSFHVIGQKNALFVYPLRDWWDHPFTFLQGNLTGMFDWFVRYLTIPLAILIVFSLFIEKEFTKEKILALGYFLAPFLITALFGKTLYPRFILFMILPLLPLIALCLDFLLRNLKPRIFGIIVLILCIVVPLQTDFYILSHFAKAPIPHSDVQQYSNSWTAGWGVREATALFKEEATDKKIQIITQGTFGLMPYAFEIYLHNNPNITIQGLWPIEETVSDELRKKASEKKTFFVFYQPCTSCQLPGDAPKAWSVDLVKRYTREVGLGYLSIYTLR